MNQSTKVVLEKDVTLPKFESGLAAGLDVRGIKILAAYKELEKQKKVLDSELKKRTASIVSTQVQPQKTNQVNNGIVIQKVHEN